jgi:hypothetical protein
MTTGRINQVTILNSGPKATETPELNQAEQFTKRRFAPQLIGTPELGYNRDLTTIQLPPLSSLQNDPPHECSSARRFPTVPHTPRRRRIPSTDHVRDGYLLAISSRNVLLPRERSRDFNCPSTCLCQKLECSVVIKSMLVRGSLCLLHRFFLFFSMVLGRWSHILEPASSLLTTNPAVAEPEQLLSSRASAFLGTDCSTGLLNTPKRALLISFFKCAKLKPLRD